MKWRVTSSALQWNRRRFRLRGKFVCHRRREQRVSGILLRRWLGEVVRGIVRVAVGAGFGMEKLGEMVYFWMIFKHCDFPVKIVWFPFVFCKKGFRWLPYKKWMPIFSLFFRVWRKTFCSWGWRSYCNGTIWSIGRLWWIAFRRHTVWWNFPQRMKLES